MNMHLLSWTAVILWVRDASSRTTTITSQKGLAVPAQTTTMLLDDVILNYLIGLPLNPSQSAALASGEVAAGSLADAYYSRFLYPALPTSEYSVIESVGLNAAELKYGESFTVQPWYSRLLDEVINYDENIITLLENVAGVTATAGIRFTTEVETYLLTNRSTTVIVTSTTTAAIIYAGRIGPTPSISVTATETILVTTSINGIQVVYSQATSLGFTITSPPILSNPAMNATQSLNSGSNPPSTLSRTSSTPILGPPANNSSHAERMGIGIGLGLGLSLLLLIGVISFILRLRRRGKKRRLSVNVESSGISGGGLTEKAELDANSTSHEIRRQSQRSEADGTGRYELGGEIQRQEMDGTSHKHDSAQPLQPQSVNETERYELDGGDDYHKSGEGDRSQSEEGDVSALSE